MKKLFLIALVWASMLSIAFAQDTTRKETTQKSKKWELSTDVLFLTNKASIPPHLFVRRHFKNSALRLRLGVGNKKTDLYGILFVGQTSPAVGGGIETTPTVFSSRIDMGYEWRKTEGKLFYYSGGDMFFNYAYEKSIQQQSPQNNPNNITYAQIFQKNNYIIGLALIGGIGYRVHPRMSVSAETGLQFGLNRIRGNVRVEEYPIDDPNTPSNSNMYDITYHSIRLINESFFNFLPIRSINLSFHF